MRNWSHLRLADNIFLVGRDPFQIPSCEFAILATFAQRGLFVQRYTKNHTISSCCLFPGFTLANVAYITNSRLVSHKKRTGEMSILPTRLTYFLLSPLFSVWSKTWRVLRRTF